MQRIHKPSGATIEVTESEHAFLMSERLRAQADALERLGYARGYRPVLGTDPTAKLVGIRRGRDGVLRASVVVEQPGSRHRYRRNIAAPLPTSPGTQATLLLRQT